PPPLTPAVPPQESCLDSCAARLVRANHRLMGAYVGLVPALLQRRAAEHGAQAGPSGLPASPEPAPGPAEPSEGAPAAGT
ncbi:T10B translocase, partial [Prunella fulvescens]|nr:T10B translocase [Prunella fulvescens]